jgi:hypothetical protein
MDKRLLLLGLLICFQGICQEPQNIQIDRFDNDKNDWGLETSEKWGGSIENGKLIIENKVEHDWIYFYSENLINLENKAYTLITFDFQIDDIENNNGGAGFVFINDKNSEKFERVRLVIQKDYSFFDKHNIAYPDGGFLFDDKIATPKLRDINNVKIILNNNEDVEKGKKLTLSINGTIIFQSEWAISNFNKIGFISQRLNKTSYDNLVIKQSEEINIVLDAFDLMFIDGKQRLDHNGIETNALLKYIPIEMVDNQNLLSTKELIKSLRNNNKCSSIKTKMGHWGDEKREMLSFSYANNVQIEFFSDSESPNPISVYFLEKDDLDDFFKIYTNYNSYRYTNDEMRSTSPLNPFYSILKFDDTYKVAFWRGMDM